MAHGHSQHAAHHVNYMAIFWWLLALTILEVAAGYPSSGPAYPHMLKGLLLVIMALTKAALVALYFMHLKFERVALGYIAMIPLVLCVFVVLMTLPDF
ncbi:MAG: cytochrome C oxidase subunit IV family protein [Candidatus Tectomicrobia bacterium]|uniref:Cytochrome C oxidase subunit IV family protein n=1 Tax=Tectimicrobiota bacterium TaxID=2528274 RepID=A0A932I173_UNCTE|nr:cytochrome C oxidase subunit IV family protein [Candidatus Tectomicrobia bacterium]